MIIISQFIFQRTQLAGKALEDEEAGFSFSRDSTPNTSFSSSTLPNMKRGGGEDGGMEGFFFIKKPNLDIGHFPWEWEIGKLPLSNWDIWILIKCLIVYSIFGFPYGPSI